MKREIGLRRRLDVGLLAACLLLGGCAANADAMPASPASAAAIVGTNPGVQQWFKRHEPQTLAVDNALQQAYVQLDTGAGTGCAQLKAAAAALIAALPTPKHELDGPATAGTAEFSRGADQCQAGDVAGARQSIAAGVAARANAEAVLEELLEEPDGAVH